MRIQHNITAMNAYRNYTNNTSSVAKNLEKLSSGYKINRAGDDAAGLAISEKMRAQITGLEVAQKNAKDGISLVQTAEGALTEVHDMLNRMYELAEQSANGTYDDAVDRANLQKEITSLSAEINRIADSANFNGINLLDGSLAGPAKVETTAGVDASGGVGGAAAIYTIDVSTVVAGDATGSTGIDGTNVTWATDLDTTMGNFVSTYNGDGSKAYTASYSGGTLTLTAKAVGAVATDPVATLQGGGSALTVTEATEGEDPTGGTPASGAVTTLDFTGKTGGKIHGNTLTVGGTTYEFVQTGETAKTQGATAIQIATDANAAAIASAVQSAVTVTGNTVAVGTDTNTVTITNNTPGAASVPAAVEMTGGLTLQIGDTSDSFNQLGVSVKDMHTSGMGIGTIDISSQTGAATAMTSLKDAINFVSDVRGDLGATQNRLEHTINNLAVMTENIQDAESSIRDIDVAEEMMIYTKNNILVQSAQAMLAQANQLPQGVLQLLQ